MNIDSVAATASEAGVSRRGQLGWALYQLASDPYFVMVNIFVFAPYFEGTIVGNYVHGQELWGYVQGASGALIALFSPVLGAIADASGRRKPGLILFSALGLVAMSGLLWATPDRVSGTAITVIAAAVMMEFAVVFHNAMLTSIASPRRIGFLIYPDCDILDVCGPCDAFHYADIFLPRFGRTSEPGYQCDILAAAPGPVRTSCGIELVATHGYCDIKDGLDTLVVAGGIGAEQACKDASLVEWVRSMAPRVRRVASGSAFMGAAPARARKRAGCRTALRPAG